MGSGLGVTCSRPEITPIWLLYRSRKMRCGSVCRLEISRMELFW